MSVSTLTIPTPESCIGKDEHGKIVKRCSLTFGNPIGMDFCVVTRETIGGYTSTRHPDCPLIIQPKCEKCEKEFKKVLLKRLAETEADLLKLRTCILEQNELIKNYFNKHFADVKPDLFKTENGSLTNEDFDQLLPSDEDNIDNLDFDILDHVVDIEELDPPEEG